MILFLAANGLGGQLHSGTGNFELLDTIFHPTFSKEGTYSLDRHV